MVSIDTLFKNDKYAYPHWIKNNPVFNELSYIRKVFPTIGLSNFEKKIVINNHKEIISFANQLLDVIADNMSNRITKLSKFAKKGKIGKKRRKQLELILGVMGALGNSIRIEKSKFINITPTGKIALAIPNDIVFNDDIFLKSGSGVFKTYDKISLLLEENKFLKLNPLHTAPQFKSFSSINIPSKENLVIFRSDGAEGIWDIATMSQRGIHSCQTWDQGVGNGGKIIGSMIDPFTAIIYLTSGEPFNTFGSKMIRRCIVRYVIDEQAGPYLLLEKMYPAFDKPSLDTFVDSIKEQISTIPIFYAPDIGGRATYDRNNKLFKSYIPLSDELKLLDPRLHPYVDSAVIFKSDNSRLSKSVKNLHFSFKTKVASLLPQALASRKFTKSKVAPFGTKAVNIINQLKGKTFTICKCKKSSCVNIHKKLSNNFVNELSVSFADFVCRESDNTDPFTYLADHKQKCLEFITSKLSNNNDNFNKFVAQNIIEYIEKQVNK